MDACLCFILFVLSCIGSGLATQGILQTVYKIHSSIFILMGNEPEGLIRKAEKEEEEEEEEVCGP
jgi:hypothetical protein